MPGCFDCHLPYDDPGFADFVLDNDDWRRVSPDGEGNGLLCVTCMTRRARAAGLSCSGRFTSGPFAEGWGGLT